jgi:hypothetical protein
MKYLLTLALIFSAAAHADVLATSANTGGGKIVLTDAAANCKDGGRMVYSTLPTGNFLAGCWKIYDDQVFVVYADGTSRLYDITGFTMRAKKAPARAEGSSL